MIRKAVFLDRDGVLIEDSHLRTTASSLQILPGVPLALGMLKELGFLLIVVTNQTVVARGLLTRSEMEQLNRTIVSRLEEESGITMDDLFYCPHHPNAQVPEYRIVCSCRKPEPGMLLEAARKYQISCSASFMVGDRITDCLAGAAAGCRTVLLKTGCHDKPVIETGTPVNTDYKSDYICDSLLQAAQWIGQQL